LHLTICTVFVKYLDKFYQYILLIIQKKYREHMFVNVFFSKLPLTLKFTN